MHYNTFTYNILQNTNNKKRKKHVSFVESNALFYTFAN